MEYEEFKKEVIRRRNLLNKKQLKLDKESDALKIFLKDCPHEELELREDYFEGSYYDKARTTYWNQCKLCGVSSDVTVETHSWYG